MVLEENMSITKQRRRINYVKIGLAGLLLRGTVADLINALFGLSPFVEGVINFIAIAMFLVGLSEVLLCCSKVVIGSFVVFSILWGFSYLFYPNNRPYIIDEYIQFFIYSLPFLWMGYYLVKTNTLIDLVIPIAKIKLILALIVQILILLHLSRDIFNGDHQTTSYSLIFGLTALYYKSTRDKRFDDIALSIIGTIVLLLVGSRSIFISILFYWLVYFLLTVKQHRYRIFLAIFAFIVILTGFDSLVNELSSVAESVGYSTHLTNALSENTIFEDEARTLLYTGFISFVKESPFGYGIMGDRYLSCSSGLFRKPIYPHNIFLEVCIDFGYVIGLILLVVLIIYILKGFIKRDNRTQMTILILLSSSFIKLLFASTFWSDQLFFMLIGCLLAINHTTEIKNKYL